MAAEAMFRQVRRPPPRIYRGIPFPGWTSDGIAGDGGRRGVPLGLALLLEECGEALAHTCCSELDLLLLATVAPVREYIGSALCLQGDNLVRSCCYWSSILYAVYLYLTIGNRRRIIHCS